MFCMDEWKKVTLQMFVVRHCKKKVSSGQASENINILNKIYHFKPSILYGENALPNNRL